MHTQWDMGHNTCYIPSQVVIANGGSGGMELVAVCLLNDLLDSAVFQITGIPTQDKEQIIYDMSGTHTQRGVGRNPCYTSPKIVTVTGDSRSMETAAVHLLNATLH